MRLASIGLAALAVVAACTPVTSAPPPSVPATRGESAIARIEPTPTADFHMVLRHREITGELWLLRFDIGPGASALRRDLISRSVVLPRQCSTGVHCTTEVVDTDRGYALDLYMSSDAPPGSYVLGFSYRDRNDTVAFEIPQTPFSAATPAVALRGGPVEVQSSFIGVESVQSPPDIDLAVGPASVLLTTNSEYVLRDKSGTLIARVPTRTFYARYLNLAGGGVVDSEALYDEPSSRFFIGASGSSGQGPWSAYLLAVSKSSTPRTLSDADWYFYSLDGRIDRLAGGDRPTTFNVDGTALTVGSNIVVMTARMESFHLGVTQNISQYMKIRVIDKAAALDGTLSDWRDVIGPTFPGTNTVAIGIIPIHAIDASARIFFAQPGGCGFYLWSLDDTFPPSALTGGYAQRLPKCTGNYGRQPVDAPQPGGAAPLSVSNVAARDFKGTYLAGRLYLVQLTGWDGPAGVTNAIRWAQVDVSAWPQSAYVAQQVVISPNDATVFYPALAVNRAGDVALVFGRSSASEAASIWVTGRSAADPPGTLRTPVLLHAGASAFETGVYGYNRWADYFGAALDPVDGSLWVSGQYPVARTASATWVARVRVVP